MSFSFVMIVAATASFGLTAVIGRAVSERQKDDEGVPCIDTAPTADQMAGCLGARLVSDRNTEFRQGLALCDRTDDVYDCLVSGVEKRARLCWAVSIRWLGQKANLIDYERVVCPTDLYAGLFGGAGVMEGGGGPFKPAGTR